MELFKLYVAFIIFIAFLIILIGGVCTERLYYLTTVIGAEKGIVENRDKIYMSLMYKFCFLSCLILLSVSSVIESYGLYLSAFKKIQLSMLFDALTSDVISFVFISLSFVAFVFFVSSKISEAYISSSTNARIFKPFLTSVIFLVPLTLFALNLAGNFKDHKFYTVPAKFDADVVQYLDSVCDKDIAVLKQGRFRCIGGGGDLYPDIDFVQMGLLIDSIANELFVAADGQLYALESIKELLYEQELVIAWFDDKQQVLLSTNGKESKLLEDVFVTDYIIDMYIDTASTKIKSQEMYKSKESPQKSSSVKNKNEWAERQLHI